MNAHTGTIVSINPPALVFSDGSHQHSLTLAPSCIVKLDGAAATVGQLKAGMKATVTVAADKRTCTEVDATGGGGSGLVACTTLGQTQQGLLSGLFVGSNFPPASYQYPALAPGPVARFGMSNEFYESEHLLGHLPADLAPGVRFVNCAHKGASIHNWSDPGDPVWAYFGQQLSAAGVPLGGFSCAIFQDAFRGVDPEMSGVHDWLTAVAVHKNGIQAAIRVLLNKYPQVKMVLLKSRTYAGYAAAGSPSNVEPYANAQGWATAKVVAEHVAGGDGIGTCLDWASYQWANGAIPNPAEGLASDGLAWAQSDYQSDGIHPSDPQGVTKCNNVELGYLRKNPATRWMFK